MTSVESRRFVCPSCGSSIAYAPGTDVVRCTSCGAEQRIDHDDATIVEHSYDAWAALPAKPVATIGAQVLHCQGCGATTETTDLAGACQFCSGVLVAVDLPDGVIAPEAVVPFVVDRAAANASFVSWVRSRRFAPNALKKVGSTEAITGTYVPHWTFDARTNTDYRGRRGDHYWVTVTDTVPDGRGGTTTRTRQEQRTRWTPVSGRVARDFDDVVVRASTRLPAERLEKAGPWDLGTAVGYAPDYLAGFAALRYDVDPDAGRADAQARMEPVIEQDCRADIGGDEQHVGRMNVHYAAVMFKLVLLPLWIASYLYAGRSYQVMVNANTGEVVGEHPLSKLKIALAVLAGLLVVAAVVVGVILARR
jgi:LSD1 subclass zinc finger protein